MIVLVTGSLGVFGRYIVPALIDAGHTVRHYDILQGLDVRDRDALSLHLDGVDIIVHLAAIPWGMPKYSAKDYWTVNVDGTSILTDAAIEAGVERLILASSTGYYGFQRGWPFGTKPAHVNDLNVVQRYGICTEPGRLPKMNAEERSRLHYMTSKVGAETALAARAIGGEIQGVVLRFAPVVNEPYEWGIWCTTQCAVNAVLGVIGDDQERPFVVWNVGEPCDILPECYATSR